MLKLGCVNCGAPLEISPDLDVFACGFCGSQQRVERKGGVVALRRVEAAIKAVQRGTDRTAAELALPRLAKELSEAEAQRVLAVAAAKEKRESAARGRRMLSIVTFGVVFLGGPALIAALPSSTPSSIASGFAVVWIIASIAAPIFVFRKTRLPVDTSSQVAALFDERILKIRTQIRANRDILDRLPE